jgi:hypothetical protein
MPIKTRQMQLAEPWGVTPFCQATQRPWISTIPLEEQHRTTSSEVPAGPSRAFLSLQKQGENQCCFRQRHPVPLTITEFILVTENVAVKQLQAASAENLSRPPAHTPSRAACSSKSPFQAALADAAAPQ